MVVGALFLFSLQDIVIKSFADDYSVLQIVFIRGLVALVPLALMVRLACRGRRVVLRRTPWLLLRGALGFASFLGYYLAIAALPLAQAVTIAFTAPVFATALSALLLREPVGWRRWCAVLVGFAAVAVIVAPDGLDVRLGAMLALGAALAYALMTLTTRHIGQTVLPSVMALVSMLVFLLASGLSSVYVAVFCKEVVTLDPALLFLLRPWRVPAAEDFALMLLIGVIATFGFYYLTKAYWVAPVSVVAPFEYSYVIWAVGFGYLIWGEVPAATTLGGLVLLVGSSLYILHREVLRAAPGDDNLIAARASLPADTDQRIESDLAGAGAGVHTTRTFAPDPSPGK